MKNILIVLVAVATSFAFADNSVTEKEVRQWEDALENGTTNAKETIAKLSSLSENGQSSATASLAAIYLYGIGVDVDGKQAFMFAKKAVEQKDSRGEILLAECYHYGSGVESNLTEAVKWYQKSAEHGRPAAQVQLGVMYEDGLGVEKNLSVATKWYLKAAEQGWMDGQYAVADMYEHGKGVKKDINEAIKWYEKAAGQNDGRSSLALGNLYYNGEDVELSLEKALKWYEHSAANGSELAKKYLEDTKKELQEKELQKFDTFAGFKFGVKSKTASLKENDVELKKPFRYFNKADLEYSNESHKLMRVTLKGFLPDGLTESESKKEYKAVKAIIEKKYGIQLHKDRLVSNSRDYEKDGVSINIVWGKADVTLTMENVRCIQDDKKSVSLSDTAGLEMLDANLDTFLGFTFGSKNEDELTFDTGIKLKKPFRYFTKADLEFKEGSYMLHTVELRGDLPSAFTKEDKKKEIATLCKIFEQKYGFKMSVDDKMVASYADKEVALKIVLIPSGWLDLRVTNMGAVRRLGTKPKSMSANEGADAL